MFNFGDWHRLAFVSSAGIFVGVVAAPSIEPRAFKIAWAYELGFGCLAGAVLGWVLGASVEIMGIGALGGAMLGYFVPYWVNHVHIP